MNIDKAIEILKDENSVEWRSPDHDYRDAIKLGIEALKQIQQIRAYAKKLYLPLLPGEAE